MAVRAAEIGARDDQSLTITSCRNLALGSDKTCGWSGRDAPPEPPEVSWPCMSGQPAIVRHIRLKGRQWLATIESTSGPALGSSGFSQP